jgi:hypothetical protein
MGVGRSIPVSHILHVAFLPLPTIHRDMLTELSSYEFGSMRPIPPAPYSVKTTHGSDDHTQQALNVSSFWGMDEWPSNMAYDLHGPPQQYGSNTIQEVQLESSVGFEGPEDLNQLLVQPLPDEADRRTGRDMMAMMINAAGEFG